MSTTIRHRKVNIVVLEGDEGLAENCRPGDIAIVRDDQGWWTKFVDIDGNVESYDIAFDSYNKALWAAKAAAEFGC
jgi:hypothetical protein